jgi:hypothetical protein
MAAGSGKNAGLNRIATESDLDYQPRLNDESDELGARDIAGIFTEISRGAGKWLWFVEAHPG